MIPHFDLHEEIVLGSRGLVHVFNFFYNTGMKAYYASPYFVGKLDATRIRNGIFYSALTSPIHLFSRVLRMEYTCTCQVLAPIYPIFEISS